MADLKVLSKELKGILTQAAAPVAFEAWLTREELTQPEDLALLASEEKEVQVAIIDASGLRDASLKDKVAIKKCWWIARSQADRSSGVTSGRVQEKSDQPLNDTVVEDLHTQWARRHNFAIPTHRLLADTLLGQVYRGLHSSPPKISIILPESIRLLSATERRSGQALVLQPNSTVHCQEVVSDELTGHHELWKRV